MAGQSATPFQPWPIFMGNSVGSKAVSDFNCLCLSDSFNHRLRLFSRAAVSLCVTPMEFASVPENFFLFSLNF